VTLLELATVGTDALEGVEAITTGTGADGLLAGRREDTRERRLLLAAGCDAVLTRAASPAARAPALPPPAPPETKPVLPDRVASALLAMLDSDTRDLLPAVLPRLATSGHIVPPAALRPLLRRVPEALRPVLRPILGSRARWLAERGASWRWLLDGEDGPVALAPLLASFEVAASAERPRLLGQIRALDAKAGRDALRACWTSEAVEGRLALVPALHDALSLADEALLVQITDKDRSKRVKEAARRLLAQIPGSSFALERLEEVVAGVTLVPRARPKMSIVKQIFGRSAALPPTLEVSLGQQAMLTLLELVPPSALAARWTMTPAEVLLGVQDDDEALLVGLSLGVLLHRESAWTLPLLDRWARMPQTAIGRDQRGRDLISRVLEMLPPAARAARIIERMPNHAATDWWPMLATWDALWTEDLGQHWLTLIAAHLEVVDAGASEATSAALTWRSSLGPAAARLPESQLRAASRLAVASDEISPRWFRALSEFQTRITLRLSIEEALIAMSALPPFEEPHD